MTWQPTNCPPQLGGDDIHIWRFPLVNHGDYSQHAALLAEDESRRAARFLFEKHREHFVIGRAVSRQILSLYLDIPPEKIDFAYENLGKPRFRDETLFKTFRFNVSNSHDQGLLAITLGTEIGVDLERIRPMSDMLGLAKRYFAEAETARLFALPEEEQPAAFFRYWTRKEAYLKAVGKGLTYPLRNVHVELADTPDGCHILEINGDATEAAQWQLTNLNPRDNFKGAFAIRRKDNSPFYFEPATP